MLKPAQILSSTQSAQKTCICSFISDVSFDFSVLRKLLEVFSRDVERQKARPPLDPDLLDRHFLRDDAERRFDRDARRDVVEGSDGTQRRRRRAGKDSRSARLADRVDEETTFESVSRTADSLCRSDVESCKLGIGNF